MAGNEFDGGETQLKRDSLEYAVGESRRRMHLYWVEGRQQRTVAIESRAVIGSSSGAGILVQDPTVSRLHAELDPRRDGVWIRDLGSKNGTFVNDMLVTAVRLPDGAKVQVGTTVFGVRYANEASPVAVWPEEQFGPLVGRSTRMRELFLQLSRIAPSESTVLVHGETGTGKELVARAIHEASPRRNGPYVVVDCASLAENLLEAELFGYARGAFTGAVSSRNGAIQEAEGGTVFLDEIGELPLAMQPKLLRAIESRTVRRIGEATHRPVNVRFVSATHRDLREMVNAGGFREDLYFRLAVLVVDIPALRERPDDIPLLVQHLLGPDAKHGVDPELVRELTSRPWLGNVRELRNFVERARALGANAAVASLPTTVAKVPNSASQAFPPVTIDEPFKDLRERWLNHFEREYLVALMARHGHNVSAMATAAGLDRTYIHRLLRKHQL